ncbi:MAG: hypothetical protein GXO33_05915 [Epsilonproteobacteria bacterium]|nr:hypothetical protein [Campylobacterota bacterium]
MNDVTLTVGALTLVMLILALYIALRDREINRKLALMERGIDTLNDELYRLTKELEKSRRELHERIVRFELEQRSGVAEVPEGVWEERLAPLREETAQLKTALARHEAEAEEKLAVLRKHLKETMMASGGGVPDEQRILQLHAQGLDSETIAKKLRMGKGEVELVLRFAKING